MWGSDRSIDGEGVEIQPGAGGVRVGQVGLVEDLQTGPLAVQAQLLPQPVVVPHPQQPIQQPQAVVPLQQQLIQQPLVVPVRQRRYWYMENAR